MPVLKLVYFMGCWATSFQKTHTHTHTHNICLVLVNLAVFLVCVENRNKVK